MPFSKQPLALAISLAVSAIGNPAAAQSAPTTAAEPLMTVVVVGSKPAYVEPSSMTLDAEDLLPLRAATSDSAALLRDVPGISFHGAGGVSSLPVRHGLADDRLRIKVDGMDLIAACPNHMNSPLSYIAPSAVMMAKVYAGVGSVSVGGASIGGAIVVESAAPEFAKSGQDKLLKGEAGTFYRSNGNAVGANLAATLASEQFSFSYTGSTAQSDNYTAGDDFKTATATGQAVHIAARRGRLHRIQGRQSGPQPGLEG